MRFRTGLCLAYMSWMSSAQIIVSWRGVSKPRYKFVWAGNSEGRRLFQRKTFKVKWKSNGTTRVDGGPWCAGLQLRQDSGWQFGQDWAQKSIRMGMNPVCLPQCCLYRGIMTYSLLALFSFFLKSRLWPIGDISIHPKATSSAEQTHNGDNIWKRKTGIEDPWGMAVKISTLHSIYMTAYKIEIYGIDYCNRTGAFTKYLKMLLITESEPARPREDNYLSKLSKPLNWRLSLWVIYSSPTIAGDSTFI